MFGFRRKRGESFEEWMEGVGLTEDDLLPLYGIARRRAFIIGFLSLTPLGLFLSPFWLWASGFARAIRCRSFHVRQNVFVSLIWCLWGLMTLFIYPIVISWVVIPLTRWCLRPDGKDWYIPFLSVPLFLLFAVAVTVTPIPLIVVAAVYFIIRCLRSGHVVLAVLILALSLGGSGAYLLVSGRAELPSPQALLDKLPDGPAEAAESAAQSVGNALGGITGKVRSLWHKEGEPATPLNREDIVGFWCSFYVISDFSGEEYLWAEQMEFGQDGTFSSYGDLHGKGEAPSAYSVSAFGSYWAADTGEMSGGTYAWDDEGQYLTICGRDPLSEYDLDTEDSGYEDQYRCEVQNDMLFLKSDGYCRVFQRTAWDYGNFQKTLDDFSALHRRLAGSWSTAWEEEGKIRSTTCTFSEKGTLLRQSFEYGDSVYLDLPDKAGWYTEKKPLPPLEGVYYFDGTCLVFKFWPEDYTTGEDLVEVYTGVVERDGFLELDGARYVPDNGSMNVQDLCAATGFSYPAS